MPILRILLAPCLMWQSCGSHVTVMWVMWSMWLSCDICSAGWYISQGEKGRPGLRGLPGLPGPAVSSSNWSYSLCSARSASTILCVAISLSSTGWTWYQGRQWTKRRKGSKGQSADCYLILSSGLRVRIVSNEGLYSTVWLITTWAPPCIHFLHLGWWGQARKDWFLRTSRKKGTGSIAS